MCKLIDGRAHFYSVRFGAGKSVKWMDSGWATAVTITQCTIISISECTVRMYSIGGRTEFYEFSGWTWSNSRDIHVVTVWLATPPTAKYVVYHTINVVRCHTTAENNVRIHENEIINEMPEPTHIGQHGKMTLIKNDTSYNIDRTYVHMLTINNDGRKTNYL